jgi:hypothetical protein
MLGMSSVLFECDGRYDELKRRVSVEKEEWMKA